MNVQTLSRGASGGGLQGFGESELVIDDLGHPSVPAVFSRVEVTSKVLLMPGFEHTPSPHVSVF